MTSIEWFAKELKKRYKRNNAHLTISEWAANMIDKLEQQAKAMHKAEIIDAVENGNYGNGKEYYNETFKKD